jgi:hypothetical protein
MLFTRMALCVWREKGLGDATPEAGILLARAL